MGMVNGNNDVNYGEIWRLTTRRTASIREQAVDLRTVSLNGPIRADKILNFGPVLEDAIDQFEFAAGLGQRLINEGREQIGDDVRDIAGEYTIMIAALKNLRTALVSGFPNAGGILGDRQWSPDGTARTVPVTYATGHAISVALRLRLDAIIDSIDEPITA